MREWHIVVSINVDIEEGHDALYQYKHLLESSLTESTLYEEVQAALPAEVMGKIFSSPSSWLPAKKLSR